MNARIVFAAFALVLALALVWRLNREVDVAGAPATVHAPQPDAAPTARAAPPAADEPDAPRHSRTEAPSDFEMAEEPVAQTNDKVFRTDPRGELVLDEHTRLNLEALIARTPPEALDRAKQEIAASLSPAAGTQAAELVDRYVEYDIAQRQAYPPGRAPSTEEEALAELDGLHALREAHFGAGTAQAFYAEEEALNRELLELMKLEKDQSLTLAEKADRAQRMRDALPNVAAAERKP